MAGGGGSGGGLPAGWEWDYDGSRWFYKYKPNGHIQYHFPSEGDEFPDFVDAASPAPALAPEERLESQQQVRRVTGAAPPPPSERRKAAKRGMTATARPVGIEWDGDMGGDDSFAGGVGENGVGGGSGGGEGVFQPENFMFLGPSTYVDVSPLNEDEEEAAKRSVVGITQTVDGGATGEGGHKVISPAVSTAAGTPAMKSSEPVMELERAENENKPPPQQPNATTPQTDPAITSFEIQVEAVIAPPPPPVAAAETTTTQVLAATAEAAVEVEAESAPPPIPQKLPIEQEEQRYELAVPDRPFDPVGIIAEMATEDTPRSHIELNPIPVEIDDSSVLAPIETAPPLGIAELSAQTSPKEPKAPSALWGKKQTEETKKPAAAAAATAGQVLPNSQQSASSSVLIVHAANVTAAPVTLTPMPLPATIKKKSTEASKAIYSPVSASSPADSLSPVSAPAPTPSTSNTPQYKPYAPVSPLHRADTAPVQVPLAKPDTTLRLQPPQQEQSAAAPVSPVLNPQLTYAPSVLRPAHRQSRQQQQNAVPVLPQQVPSVGSIDTNHLPALNPARCSQVIQPSQAPPMTVAGADSSSPQQQINVQQHPHQTVSGHGATSPLQRRPLPGQQIQPGHQIQPTAQQPVPAQQYHPQTFPGQAGTPNPTQQPQPYMTQQNLVQHPFQHDQPVGMAPGQYPPGQYPPVPIPQPYGQYQNYSQAPLGPQAPHQWYAPGQQGQAQPHMMPYYSQGPQHEQIQQPTQHQQQHQQVIQQQLPQHQHQFTQQQQQQPSSSTNIHTGPQTSPQPMAQTTRPNNASPAPSQLPQRPQSVMGLIPPSNQPVTTPSPDTPSQINTPRRSSTLDSAGISPLRPRAESQSSNPPMASPSPIEPPRSGSIAASIVSSLHSQPSGQPEQSRPIDVKVGTGLDKKGDTPGTGASAEDSYFPPRNEHPIGLVGKIAEQFASEMGQISSASGSTTAPNVTRPEAKLLVGTPSPGAGYALGRIDEHETETASVSANPGQASKRNSLVSAVQQTPLTGPTAIPTQPVHPNAEQQAPLRNTGQPPHGPLPPLNVSAGTAPPQSQHSPASLPPQNAGLSPGQAVPPSSVGPTRPMPPQGFTAQQQWQGTMQQTAPGMSRPGSVPPQMQMQPNKGKDNKWTKWFKSSKSTKRPEHPQIGQHHQQPPPPGWSQPWQPGPPMQSQPIQGPPMQQHPFQAPPHIVGPMQPPNMTAGPAHYISHPGPGPQTQHQLMPQPNQPGQPNRMVPQFGLPMQQSQLGAQLQIPPQAGQGSPVLPTAASDQHNKNPSLTSVASLPHTGPVQSPTHGAGPPAMDNAMMPKPLSLRPRSGVFTGNPIAPHGQSNGQMQ